MIAKLMVNSNPSLIHASMDKILSDNYFCLVKANKQQIKEIRSKSQLENKPTPNQVWIRLTFSVPIAFNRQEDKKSS